MNEDSDAPDTPAVVTAPEPTAHHPAHRSGTLWSLAADIVAPIALYYGIRAAGGSIWLALIAGAVLPAASAVAGLARRRRADPMGLLIVAALALSAGLSLATGSPRALLARDGLLTGAWACYMYASVLAARPATFVIARPLLEGRRVWDPDARAWAHPAAQDWDELWRRLPPFRRIWRTCTVIWGTAILADAVIRVIMAATLPLDLVPGLNAALWPATFVILQVVTNVYFYQSGFWRILRDGAPAEPAPSSLAVRLWGPQVIGRLPRVDVRDSAHPVMVRAVQQLARFNARHPWSHNEHFHGWILRNLPERRRAAVDIGCGTGVLAGKLAARFARVTALDTDAGMAAAAAERLAGEPGVTIRPCDFGQFADGADGDVADRGADLITMVAVLHHLPLDDTLARLPALLAPGGRLLVVGLARVDSLPDVAVDLVSAVANPLVGLVKHPHPVRPGEQPATAGPVMPIRDPKDTFAEITAAARSHLPGAVVRRRLYFRYTLRWDKPGPLR